jgi:hypothetical protein
MPRLFLPRHRGWKRPGRREEWLSIADTKGREAEVLVRFDWEIQPRLVPEVPKRLRLTVYAGRELTNRVERPTGANNPWLEVHVPDGSPEGLTLRTDVVSHGGAQPVWADGRGEVMDFVVVRQAFPFFAVDFH